MRVGVGVSPEPATCPDPPGYCPPLGDIGRGGGLCLDGRVGLAFAHDLITLVRIPLRFPGLSFPISFTRLPEESTLDSQS